MPENFIFVLIEKLWLFENNGIGKREEQQKLEARTSEEGERNGIGKRRTYDPYECVNILRLQNKCCENDMDDSKSNKAILPLIGKSMEQICN